VTVAAVGSGVLAVQARVAGIEARINALRAPAPATAAALAGAGAGGATSFDAALGQATAALGATNGSSAGAGAGDVGSAAVAAGAKYLGVPYLWGGTDPGKGLDCSGFVQRAYRDVGVELPRVSRDQAKAGQPVASLDEARPGDLVAFGSPVDHIGIYVGDGRMIVAPHTGDVVKYQDITRTPTAIRRVAPAGGSAVAAAGTAATAARAATAAAAGAGAAASTGTVAAFGAGRMASAGTSRYASLFADAAARHGVPAALLDAVAKHESGYDATAVSRAGAQGLMQIMPATARGLGVDALDPAQAVDGAARLLAGHLQRYDGSIDLALAAYNAGPGAVAKYGGVPPYEETRTYISRITSTLRSAA
jgi:cell wall-associated NlpC family hydrolase